MSLQVIGAGLGRTGTKSLKDALETLGFYRCHHMVEAFADADRFGHWEEAAETGGTDWDALFTGYRAAVDYPAARFWRALAEAYPRAKIVLTVRDPEDWYESARNTIFRASTRPFDPADTSPRVRIHRWVQRHVWEGDFGGRFEDRAHAIDVFRRHNEEVIRSLPADRLLVYETGQGWEPLTRFLGVPVPEVPYPHVNTREQFIQRVVPGVPPATT